MSIWCSKESIGFETWSQDMHDGPVGGHVRSYATGFSNHYPTDDGEWEQPAHVDLASIAPWCVPGWSEQVTGLDGEAGPWLRLGVYSIEHNGRNGRPTAESEQAIVVMDEGAVTMLRDQLTAWLNTPKVHPIEVAAEDGPGLFEEGS